MFKKVLVSTCFILCATTAMAQEQATVDIEGDTKIDVQTGAVTTTAVGKDATAVTNIGSIGAGSNVKIKGDTQIKVKTGAVTTTAVGKNTCAKANIGTIGGGDCPAK